MRGSAGNVGKCFLLRFSLLSSYPGHHIQLIVQEESLPLLYVDQLHGKCFSNSSSNNLRWLRSEDQSQVRSKDL